MLSLTQPPLVRQQCEDLLSRCVLVSKRVFSARTASLEFVQDNHTAFFLVPKSKSFGTPRVRQRYSLFSCFGQERIRKSNKWTKS